MFLELNTFFILGSCKTVNTLDIYNNSRSPGSDSGGGGGQGQGPPGAPRERKKLILAPRSVETPPAAPILGTGSGGSIFGGAKPVDTAAREREIELKMEKMNIRGGGGGVRSEVKEQREEESTSVIR